MTPEILQFLKENLKIRINSDTSYSNNMDGSERVDNHITVELVLDEEVISYDTAML